MIRTLALLSCLLSAGLALAQETSYRLLSDQVSPNGWRLKVALEEHLPGEGIRAVAQQAGMDRFNKGGGQGGTVFVYLPGMSPRSGAYAVARFAEGRMVDFSIPCSCTGE